VNSLILYEEGKKILIIENGHRDLVNSRFTLGNYLDKWGNLQFMLVQDRFYRVSFI
jgi:hypothetical protein